MSMVILIYPHLLLLGWIGIVLDATRCFWVYITKSQRIRLAPVSRDFQQQEYLYTCASPHHLRGFNHI
ncbi:hypothetical protein BDR03DRAFT_955997 [Suillus americanus]|nr:hypothetical protein BDR03DRAFT_955997 [Suillus americanus]